MICFNWQKIYKEAEGKPSKILDLIEFITLRPGPVPENKYDPYYSYYQKNWLGDSFIINPKPIIEYRSIIGQKELAEYVGIASFRNLAEYKLTGRKTLSLRDSPIRGESLKNNQLLSIADNNIYFRWEEQTH